MAVAVRRRPRWLLVGVLLSLVVLAVNAAVSSGSDERGDRLERLAWVDRVRPLVEQSTAQGAEIEQLRADPASLGREGLGRRLDRVVGQARQVLRAVREVEAPADLETARSVLVATLAIRARAVEAIRGALGPAAGAGDGAASALVRAGEELVAADRTYQVAVESVPSGGTAAPPLPPSRWVADPALWSPAEVAAFLATARAVASPGPVDDVRVLTVLTEPAAVGRESGTAVLPLVRAIRLQIVVANAGNRPHQQVPVVAALQGADGQLDTARDFVDLAPGQRRALTLGGLRPPPAGGPATLTVTVGPVPGEAPGDDNRWTLPLVLRG